MLFVLGNASIDVTLNVPQLPRPGETLMAHGIVRAPGGKGLNQAVVAARAGTPVRFCAPLGREAEAHFIRTLLADEPGLDTRWIDTDLPSDLSTLIVAAGGDNCIVSTGDCAPAITPAIAAAFAADMGPQDWLLVQGNLGEAATRAAVSRAPHVIFNTAPIRWRARALCQSCTIVVANAGEATELTGLDDLAAAASALGGATGIVTCGGVGCIVATADGIASLPAPSVRVVDTTGAGDTFCGVLAAARAQGISLLEAVAWAQRAAALSVTRAGCFAALPTAAELAALA